MPATRTAASLARPRLGRLLLYVLAGILGVLVLFLICVFLVLEWAAHRPSPVHANLTQEEIDMEEACLKQVGLVLRHGSFLKEHPFAPPWTAHSLPTPAEWVTGGPGLPVGHLLGSHRVRADLLRPDLDVLEPVMERAYGGWDSAASRGWNWNSGSPTGASSWAARGTTKYRSTRLFRQSTNCLRFNAITTRKSRSSGFHRLVDTARKPPFWPAAPALRAARILRRVERGRLSSSSELNDRVIPETLNSYARSQVPR